MADYVLKTEFRGLDKLSPVLNKIGVQVERTNKRMSQSFRKAGKSASMFSGVLKGMLVAGAMQRAARGATDALQGLSSEYIDFDKNITKAISRLPGELNRGSDAFKQFSDIARTEAAKTEFTAGEAAKGVEQLALAGLDVAKVYATLPGVLRLATNADIEVAEATAIAVKTMGAFNLRVEDTAQLTKNMTRVNDVFSTTVSRASLSIEEMHQTLKFVGPNAFAAGQSLETMSTLIAALANKSISASTAGTHLRMALIKMADPAGKAGKAVKKLGIKLGDSKGNYRDMIDIIEDLQKATAKMGNRQRTAILGKIFDARAATSMNALIDTNIKSIRNYEKAITEAGGNSKKMSEVIRSSLGVRLLTLKSVLTEVGFKFIEAFSGNTGKNIDILIEKVAQFDPKPIIADLKEIIRYSRELYISMRPLMEAMPTFVAMWVAYKVALKGIAIYQAVAAFFELAKVVKAATAAQGLYNAVMFASPIGLVTAAVVGFAATLFILITRYDDVNSGWQEMIGQMHLAIVEFWVSVKKGTANFVNDMIELVYGIPRAFSALSLIDIDIGEPPKVQFTSEADEKRILGIKQTIKDIGIENAGLGVKRGVAGIRGYIDKGGPAKVEGATVAPQIDKMAQSVDKLLSLTSRNIEAFSALGEQPYAPPQSRPHAPNKEQLAAQKAGFEGVISFANAPAGMSFEQIRRKGAPQISTEGLGQQ